MQLSTIRWSSRAVVTASTVAGNTMFSGPFIAGSSFDRPWLARPARSQGQTGTVVAIDFVLGLPWRSLIVAFAPTLSDEPA